MNSFLVHGFDSAGGIQCVEFSRWNSVHGIWCMEFSAWNSVDGIQCMGFRNSVCELKFNS